MAWSWSWWSLSPAMEYGHRSSIEDNIIYLSLHTKNVPFILTYLEQAHVLSSRELSLIRSCPSNTEKSYRMYERLVRKDERAFKALLEAWAIFENEPLLQLTWQPDFPRILQRPLTNGPKPDATSLENICNIFLNFCVLALTLGVPIVLFFFLVKATIEKYAYP